LTPTQTTASVMYGMMGMGMGMMGMGMGMGGMGMCAVPPPPPAKQQWHITRTTPQATACPQCADWCVPRPAQQDGDAWYGHGHGWRYGYDRSLLPAYRLLQP
jgi:hypothetical protein